MRGGRAGSWRLSGRGRNEAGSRVQGGDLAVGGEEGNLQTSGGTRHLVVPRVSQDDHGDCPVCAAWCWLRSAAVQR